MGAVLGNGCGEPWDRATGDGAVGRPPPQDLGVRVGERTQEPDPTLPWLLGHPPCLGTPQTPTFMGQQLRAMGCR